MRKLPDGCKLQNPAGVARQCRQTASPADRSMSVHKHNDRINEDMFRHLLCLSAPATLLASGLVLTGAVTAAVSTRFKVSGAVTTAATRGLAKLQARTVASSMSVDLGALRRLTAVTETVGAHTCIGVGFWELLSSSVGINLNANVKNDCVGPVRRRHWQRRLQGAGFTG